MPPDSTQPTESPARGDASGRFCTTHWTQVRRAKADSADGREALAALCAAYYEPVATFLRCRLRDADAARELAHEFFAAVLAGGAITHAEQERGRFRSYLLGAVKHFLSHRQEAALRLRRGGGVECVPLDDEDGEAGQVPDKRVLSPDAEFDRQWALTVLARTLDTLRDECTADGRAEFFENAKPWLTGEAAHGDQRGLAASCGKDPNVVKVAVHRLKRRFRELLKAEIAHTLDDASQVESEMRALFAALGG